MWITFLFFYCLIQVYMGACLQFTLFREKVCTPFHQPSSPHHVFFVANCFSLFIQHKNVSRSYSNNNNRYTHTLIHRCIHLLGRGAVFSSSLFVVWEWDSECVYVFYQWIRGGPSNDDNFRVTNLWTYFEMLCSFHCFVYAVWVV